MRIIYNYINKDDIRIRANSYNNRLRDLLLKFSDYLESDNVYLVFSHATIDTVECTAETYFLNNDKIVGIININLNNYKNQTILTLKFKNQYRGNTEQLTKYIKYKLDYDVNIEEKDTYKSIYEFSSRVIMEDEEDMDTLTEHFNRMARVYRLVDYMNYLISITHKYNDIDYIDLMLKIDNFEI